MRKINIVVVAGLFLSSTAFAITAEEMNAEKGRAVIVADVTPPPKSGAIDIAKKVPPNGGAGGQAAGAAMAGGASIGNAVGGGLLLGALMAPRTYDSRWRLYRVVVEKDCKVERTISQSAEADLSGLMPGQFGIWMNSPSGGQMPRLLTTLKGSDGKPVPKIDASHPCFAAYEAAVKELAESKAAEKQAAAK